MSGSIARRYARALMELGVENGQFENYGKQLSGLSVGFAESKELQDALTNPAFNRSVRKDIVAAIANKAGAAKEVKNFLALLVDRDRITDLSAISRELQTLIDEKQKAVTAEVKSAVPLTAEQASRLTKALEKISGKKVQLDQKVDPSIIGGAIAKIGDNVYDGSLKQQLTELGRTMAR